MATKQDVLHLEMKIEAVRSELRSEFRTELHSGLSGVMRQMYAAMLGQMAVLLGAAYFFVTHVTH